MSEQIAIGTEGAKKVLRKYDPKKSITEYIWNGFDAGATEIKINIKLNDIGILSNITIEDNGTGIDSEQLGTKFKPFYESIKEDEEYETHSSKCHGRNGLGRLTFFTFANFAEWKTIYAKSGKRYEYSISIKASELKKFDKTVPTVTTKASTGTIVTFTGIFPHMNDKELIDEIIEYIRQEFCWFIELRKNTKIILNGEELDFSDNVTERDSIKIKVDNLDFILKYVGWKKLNKSELSKIYYLSEKENEIYKEFTQLNRKSDGFFHSVFVSSVYFENFKFDSKREQSNLDIKGRSDKIFQTLLEKIREFLVKKRKPILKANSKVFFKANYEDEGIVTEKGKTGIEKYKATEVKGAIQELWIIEPKIFSGLNTEQKSVMANFIELCLDTGERDRLIEIIGKIVKLEPEDRIQLEKILKDAELSYVIKTLNMITDRFKKIEWLRQLIFKQELKAKEVQHVQKMIESMTWIFGEQFATLGKQEDNFEKLLRKYRLEVGDLEEISPMGDPNKKKEVDLFLCRKEVSIQSIDNLIIELKRPSVKIGKKQIEQIETYMITILKEKQFNNISNATWTFILVGTDFDSDGYTDSRVTSLKSQNIPGLILQNKNYKIIVKKWSELLADFEIKHKFIQDELKLDRDKLVAQENNADSLVKTAVFEKYEEKAQISEKNTKKAKKQPNS